MLIKIILGRDKEGSDKHGVSLGSSRKFPGTPKLAPYIALISQLNDPNSFYARPEGLEPPT